MGAADPAGTVPLPATAQRLLDVAGDVAALPDQDTARRPDLPGALGIVSDRLYQQWQLALLAREAEAHAVADRLGQLAGGLLRSAQAYRSADEDAVDRLRRAEGAVLPDPARRAEDAGPGGSTR